MNIIEIDFNGQQITQFLNDVEVDGNVIPINFCKIENYRFNTFSNLLEIIVNNLKNITTNYTLTYNINDVLYIDPVVAYLYGIELGVKNDKLRKIFGNHDELFKSLWEYTYLTLTYKFWFVKYYLDVNKLNKDSDIVDVLSPKKCVCTRKVTTGIIYVIADNEHTKIKVGFTKNISQRLKNLENGSGSTLYVVKTINDRLLQEEKEFHAMYKHLSTKNEWYPYSKQMLNVIYKHFS